MGGKTKQTQRTKNNSRPSSSGRSAELLGVSVPQFVGFTAIENCGFVPVVPGFTTTTENLPEELDSSIDSNFQLVLRKMTKKDPITKVKALQEFTELISKSQLEEIKPILPLWPRLYSNLATDVEHRVREGAQQAQSSIVNKVGKNIAPYLRQLAASWITSQYDTYAPAASIASQSFQKSFPPNKLKEVFQYCQNEILDYIIKNLTQHTPQTICNPKSNTAEECEAKYQRVVTCSLQGYALYLDKLDSEQLLEAQEKNATIIDNDKFWSFHKHKTSSIKSSWFVVMSSVLQNAIFLLEKHEEKITACIFNNLDEQEPTVAPHVWSCVLLVQAKIKNWVNYIKLEKTVLPKLWKLLINCGSNNAQVIYPNLLPLLSNFNQNVFILDDEDSDKNRTYLITFYETFFDNIKNGLTSSHKVQLSRSDISAITLSYYECLKYAIIQIQNSKDNQLPTFDSKLDYCKKLIDAHIIDIIKWCFKDGDNLYCKYIFGHITQLINYWYQHVNNDSNKLYNELSIYFWQQLNIIVINSLDDDTNIEKITDSHLELIQNFKTSYITKTKSMKVKFNTDQDETDSSVITKEPIISYQTNLNKLVLCLSEQYMNKTNESKLPVYLHHLEPLIKDFGNLEFLQSLADNDNIYLLYDKFSKWLEVDSLKLEIVVDIILYIYKFLEDDDKYELLDKLIKFPDQSVQNWVILRVLSHPLCTEPSITKVLAQGHVTDHLVRCAYTVINKHNRDNLNLLHKCFFQTDMGDILIDNMTCDKIIDVMSKPLIENGRDDVLDTCASFIAQIMPVICGDNDKKLLQNKMFLRLFEFSVNKIVSDSLSEDTLWEITTSWQDALSSDDLKLDEQLLQSCSQIIDKKLFNQDPDDKNHITINCIENLSEITSKLITCSTESIQDNKNQLNLIDQILDNILNNRLKEYKRMIIYLSDLSKLILTCNGSMTIKQLKDDSTDFEENNLEKILNDCFKLSIFKLTVICKLTCNFRKEKPNVATTSPTETNDEEVVNTDEECTEDYCDLDENLIRQWSDEFYEQIIDCFYAAAIGETILYGTTQLGNYTDSLIMYLTERLILFIKHLAKDKINIIKEKLFYLANRNGGIWSKALLSLLCLEQYNDPENGPVLLYEDVTISQSNDDNLYGYINILQTLTEKIPKKSLPVEPNLFDNLNNYVIKMTSARCILNNHFTTNFNETSDFKIIKHCIEIFNNIIEYGKANKELFLYNCDLTNETEDKLLFVTELCNFLGDVLKYFPNELNLEQWDLIRIAISSWTLSISKSLHQFREPKISIFICSVYRTFSELTKFIKTELTKSSTEFLTKIIDEWQNLFAKEVHLVLLKSYMNIINNKGNLDAIQYILNELSTNIDLIDTQYVFKANKIDSKTSLNDLIKFVITNIAHKCHSVRITCCNLLRQLTDNGLIKNDMDLLNKINEQTEQQPHSQLINKNDINADNWHLLYNFKEIIDMHNNLLHKYIENFSFKLNEIDDVCEFSKDESIPYLLIWDSILYICSKAPSELRSIYATWLTENNYVQVVLQSIFRMMPVDVLRYHESKVPYIQTLFTVLEWKYISRPSVTTERYACHMYAQILRHLPAAVRKWYHGSNPRQASLVDKITTNFVSSILCQEEFRSLADKKDKQDNMQVIVHASTREIIATYNIDEAKMELTITLPVNHPLGSVKIECGKQISSRIQSRVIIQLTIFLTHQNGSIWDGLSLWKKNLDRKFEGVEECYVCYSVIHQDTCQLPRLTCKTCKKKFHGPCLYKWFSTSIKSTCPLCRNIF